MSTDPPFLDARPTGITMGSIPPAPAQEEAAAAFDLFPPMARAFRAAGLWWGERVAYRVFEAHRLDRDFREVSMATHALDSDAYREQITFDGFLVKRESLATHLERLLIALPFLPSEARCPKSDFLAVIELLRSREEGELALRTQRHFERVFKEVGRLFFTSSVACGQIELLLSPLALLRDAVFETPTAEAVLAYLHRCDALLTQKRGLLPDTQIALSSIARIADDASAALHSYLLLTETGALG